MHRGGRGGDGGMGRGGGGGGGGGSGVRRGEKQKKGKLFIYLVHHSLPPPPDGGGSLFPYTAARYSVRSLSLSLFRSDKLSPGRLILRRTRESHQKKEKRIYFAQMSFHILPSPFFHIFAFWSSNHFFSLLLPCSVFGRRSRRELTRAIKTRFLILLLFKSSFSLFPWREKCRRHHHVRTKGEQEIVKKCVQPPSADGAARSAGSLLSHV